MAKFTYLAAALCLVNTLFWSPSVDAFGITSRGMQTRLEASSLVHSAVSRSVPFESEDIVPAVKVANANVPVMNKTLRTLAKSFVLSAAVVGTIATLSPPPAYAAAKAAADAKGAVEHLHVGQKIANYFRSFGLPDLAILAIISALPVVELRGAVPVGVWMGLPITKVLPVCVLGNMAPIVPLLFLLRNDKLKNLMSPILSRAEKKSASLGVGSIEKQWASLAAFVGIPLPGTGAWTGAMGAFLLGMPTAVALSSIFTGVVAAGIIMSSITLAGKKGGIAALVALAVITGREFVSSSENSGN
jgi:uncharacterized membrane protein